MDQEGEKRIDTSTRLIKASSNIIYRAFTDPDALIRWLPPKGMLGQVDRFEAVAGGAFQLTLTYEADSPDVGKSTSNSDVVRGKFVELTPYQRIIWAVVFESDDPKFSGEMLLTWLFEEGQEGTTVTILAENVPEGISQNDHEEAFRSTLDNLARFTE